MTIIFFDDQSRESLFPLTFTRPVADLRIGILKISEKWLKHFDGNISYLTAGYLQKKFPYQFSDDNLFINGSVCPSLEILTAIKGLKDGEALLKDHIYLAAKSKQSQKAEDFE
ncbi:MAG: glucose-1-phosphate thymidylyltransferase, partial [Bacteroidetes bacterium]|nr:glucose-1-phosphate thymidylyltransferase [Bacteroidota bacterium]